MTRSLSRSSKLASPVVVMRCMHDTFILRMGSTHATQRAPRVRVPHEVPHRDWARKPGLNTRRLRVSSVFGRHSIKSELANETQRAFCRRRRWDVLSAQQTLRALSAKRGRTIWSDDCRMMATIACERWMLNVEQDGTTRNVNEFQLSAIVSFEQLTCLKTITGTTSSLHYTTLVAIARWSTKL